MKIGVQPPSSIGDLLKNELSVLLALVKSVAISNHHMPRDRSR
ncbi:hypothetical protein [Chroococcidiopsis sp. SAG 2025]|nr:hypothetical protein [Chroococcidiopsis sp. SAG 2025]